MFRLTILFLFCFSLVRSGIYAPGKAHMLSTPSLSNFPVAFETVPVCISRPFKKDRLALPLSMSLALCPQLVSQASQHFRSSEKQAISEGCFSLQPICLIISLDSGMSMAVHPLEFSKVNLDHRVIPAWVSHSTFCSNLLESVRMMACVVCHLLRQSSGGHE